MRRILLCLLLLPARPRFAADDFKLNAQEYFERPGINVMYGQDYYPEGHQGGLSIIMHDERIASNGDVRLEPSPGQWSPIPKPGKREVERGHAGNPRAARVSRRGARSQGLQSHHLSGPEARLHGARAPRRRIHSSSAWTSTRPSRRNGWARWASISSSSRDCCSASRTSSAARDGVFQRQPSGPGEIPIAGARQAARGRARDRAVSPDASKSLRGGELELLDGRGNHNNGWFVVRALAPAGATANAIEWLRHAAREGGLDAHAGDPGVAGGLSPGAAEAGHHRIRCARHAARERASCSASARRGRSKTVIDRKPEEWGKFLRYQYARARFQRREGAGRLRGALRRARSAIRSASTPTCSRAKCGSRRSNISCRRRCAT